MTSSSSTRSNSFSKSHNSSSTSSSSTRSSSTRSNHHNNVSTRSSKFRSAEEPIKEVATQDISFEEELPEDELVVEAENNNKIDDEDDIEYQHAKKYIIPYLLMHSYHLPDNKYWQLDLYQYMTNNHPLFGICLHHKYHPLNYKMRIVTLVGSILFGLAITNIIYLLFVFTTSSTHDSDVYDKEYITFQTNLTQTGINDIIDETVTTISVTNGNIVLWTIGAMIHGIFDNIIWSLAACTCCISTSTTTTTNSSRTKRRRHQHVERFLRSTGALLVMVLVVLITAIATLVVLLRVAIDADSTTSTSTSQPKMNIMQQQSQTQVIQEQMQLLHTQEFQDYEFVISYFVELVLTYLIYYPITGCILFSGILSCGKYPIIGGRPYEMKQIAKQQQKEAVAKAKAAAAAAAKEEQKDQGIEIEWESKRNNDLIIQDNTKTGATSSSGGGSSNSSKSESSTTSLSDLEEQIHNGNASSRNNLGKF